MSYLAAAAAGMATVSALGISQGNKNLAKQANASIQQSLANYKLQTAQYVDNVQQKLSGTRLQMTDIGLKGDSVEASVTNQMANRNIAGNLTARLQQATNVQTDLALQQAKASLSDTLYSANAELENLRLQTMDTMMQTATGAKYGSTTGWKAVAGIAGGAASGAMLGSTFGGGGAGASVPTGA